MDKPYKAKVLIRPASEVLRNVDVANLAEPKDERIAKEQDLLFECTTELVVGAVAGEIVNLDGD